MDKNTVVKPKKPMGRPRMLPGENRKMISIRLSPETIKRLDESPEGLTGTIERALERYWTGTEQKTEPSGTAKNGEAVKPIKDRIRDVFKE